MSGSESDEENVIKYGTPLEPYEEDEIPSKRKFQQPSDQYAVDAHGRRRFHGAFTGGFSAGYGNSVGTPEGWTPTSFKSSRTEKAERSSQRPEDYMDDEDRGEFGIAPRTLQTRAEFSGQKRQRHGFHDGPIPGEPVLEQLVRAVHETAAVKLLRRMGWRPGRAVGDRQRRRRPEPDQKVYGCYVPPEMRQGHDSPERQESGSGSSESEFEYESLFAEEGEPRASKCDRFGLGYSGLSRRSVLGGGRGEATTSHLLINDRGKRVSIRGQAFGVGAFEADDDDIYAAHDMSQYDFAIGGPPPERQKRTQPAAKGGGSGQVLEGFVRASRVERAAARHPPPALPRDYRPAPARASRFQPSDAPQRDQGLGRHELSAAARGALLGETPMPRAEDVRPPAPAAPPVKVIDFTAAAAAPANSGEDFIPLGGGGSAAPVFRPFAAEPAKQARYERYLAGGACERDGAGALAQWERDREMREFEQAARLYRPLTGAMSDRFTHASQPDDAANPLAAVARSGGGRGGATPQQQEAARRGVYGAGTRTQAPWRPDPLVCKRFNVPDLPGNRAEPVKHDKPKVSYSIFSYLENSVHDRESFTREQTKFSGSRSLADAPRPPADASVSSNAGGDATREPPQPGDSRTPNKRMTVAELFLRESESALASSATVEDAIDKFDKMDLYKSIFLSDSEPEEEASGGPAAAAAAARHEPRNAERNDSPPRGIFAGLDFDQLNSWRRSDKAEGQDKEKSAPAAPRFDGEETKSSAVDDATYGPRIPDNLKQRTTGGDGGPPPRPDSGADSSASDSWVDASQLREKHKSRKHKKHKSKHKKKHKKKDK